MMEMTKKEHVLNLCVHGYCEWYWCAVNLQFTQCLCVCLPFEVCFGSFLTHASFVLDRNRTIVGSSIIRQLAINRGEAAMLQTKDSVVRSKAVERHFFILEICADIVAWNIQWKTFVCVVSLWSGNDWNFETRWKELTMDYIIKLWKCYKGIVYAAWSWTRIFPEMELIYLSISENVIILLGIFCVCYVTSLI